MRRLTNGSQARWKSCFHTSTECLHYRSQQLVPFHVINCFQYISKGGNNVERGEQAGSGASHCSFVTHHVVKTSKYVATRHTCRGHKNVIKPIALCFDINQLYWLETIYEGVGWLAGGWHCPRYVLYRFITSHRHTSTHFYTHKHQIFIRKKMLGLERLVSRALSAAIRQGKHSSIISIRSSFLGIGTWIFKCR